MEPREYKERFCMTHGGWCPDVGFKRHVTFPKGKKNVRLECPDCAAKRKGRDADKALKMFVAAQESLPPDMAKVLHDNIWELYDNDEQ